MTTLEERSRHPYTLGLGERDRPSFPHGLGERDRPSYMNGLGERDRPSYTHGLGEKDGLPYSLGLGGRERPPYSLGQGERDRAPYPPGPLSPPRRGLWRPQDFSGSAWSLTPSRPQYRWDEDRDKEDDEGQLQSDSEDKTSSEESGGKEARRKSMLKVFSRFAERTSMQGLPYIASSKTRLAKATWALLLLVGLVFLSLHLKYLIDVYYSWNKQTRVALGFGKLPFPAVTICNTNPLRTSQLYLASDPLRELTAKLNPFQEYYPGQQQPLLRARRATNLRGNGIGLGAAEVPADTGALPTRPPLAPDKRGPAPHSNGVGPKNKLRRNVTRAGVTSRPSPTNSQGATEQQSTVGQQSTRNQQPTDYPQNAEYPQNADYPQNAEYPQNADYPHNTVDAQSTVNPRTVDSGKRPQVQLPPEERTLPTILPPESLTPGSDTLPSSSGDTLPPPEASGTGSGLDTLVTKPAVTSAQTGTFERSGVDFTQADAASTPQPPEVSTPSFVQTERPAELPVSEVPSVTQEVPVLRETPNPETPVETVSAQPLTSPPPSTTESSETLAYFSEKLQMQEEPEISTILPERSVMVDVVEEFNFLFNQERRDNRVQMGHQIEDLLLSCSFAGRTCNPRNFALRTSPSFGNCYTIQHPNFVTSQPGPVQGLQLTLFLENTEYLTGLTNSYGVQVVVHDPGSLPFPDLQGMAVSANMETNIALRLLQIERLGEPWGSCNNGEQFFKNTNRTYTRELCQQVCEQQHTAESCGCVDDQQDITLLRVARLTSTRPCSTRRDARCLVKVKRSLRTGLLRCSCDNPCSERRYEAGVSSRKWPTLEYSWALVDMICARGQNYSRLCGLLRESDYSTRGNNFLKLNIFYEDLNYENITEEPDYELVQFASDVGGTIGLYVGLSIMSAFEVVQFVLELLYFLTLGWCWQRRGAPPTSDPERVDGKKSDSRKSDSRKSGSKKSGSGKESQQGDPGDLELKWRGGDRAQQDTFVGF